MTHDRDLAIARSGFESMANDTNMVLKLWVGFDKHRQPIFDVPGAEVLQLVPFEAFYQMFGQVQTYIGLAPLCANVFNKSKSNLKFLEYTVHGAVTVASNFGPYKDTMEDGVTGILVSDNRDWYDKVRMLINDPDMHARILKNAQELVNTKYNMYVNYKLWDEAITEVVGRKND
jgi:glycosyltransferase involved in cell wall biosynthesis